MELFKSENGNHVTLSVVGTIDTETSIELRDALLALDYSDLDLTVDFKETKYITSAGLRVLLVARKKLTADTMRIIHANDSIIDVFEMTGFSEMIPIFREEASGADPYRLSFPTLLKNRVAADRDCTAYVYLDRRYTWDDVEKASQIIADDLSSLGVKKGTHVGICALNSINWIFTFFAIQKLGGIAVLVNPALRPGEVGTMAKIGDITHLCYGEIPGVTQYSAYAEALLADDSPVSRCYDISTSVDVTARFGEYPAIAEKYSEAFHADDASVVIFSSGTTSLPKAILASSYNMLISLEPLLQEVALTKADINLAFLPFFHIFGFATGISLGTMTGYVSVIPESKAPDRLIQLIDDYQCTVFNSVPTMMLAMVQHPSFAPKRLASLRASYLGGSATTEVQMQMLQTLLPNDHFGNVYGMSENAIVSLTAYEDTLAHITQTVGKPASGLELQIRDLSTGALLPPGKSGEIFVRSGAMVICYYRLAVEKQPVDDEGWLATGDIGVLDDDGYLRIVGRVKELIIRGGENISPGEIAEVIAQIPEIADVKVLGVPHEVLGEEVAAAVILKDGAGWNEEAVREYLAQRLAKYKVPAHFVVLDRFPLLGSGKVDALNLKKIVTAQIKQ